MANKHRTSGVCAFVWAVLSLLGFALMIVVSSRRGFDIYDIDQGMGVLNKQPTLVIGQHLAFGWSGAAFVFMVIAFYEWLPMASKGYAARMAVAFGLIAGIFFLFFGLVGGFGSFDMAYIQSVRSAAYVTDSYLPFILVMNRTLSAAITIAGLWFTLMNWTILRIRGLLPQWVSYLGLITGVIVLLGFVLPGGGFSLLGLLLGPLWAILAGFSLLRSQNTA